MSLPFFFEEKLNDEPSLILNEATSKHIIQVLRMRAGEQLQLTNGKGKVLIGEIISENKRSAGVKVLSVSASLPPTCKIAIAISLVKNSSRFEWFLEKAAEIGITEIIPLICERTEKQHFRYDRMESILVSAMLQSQQSWLPALHGTTNFSDIIINTSCQNKYIAHCIEEPKNTLTNAAIIPSAIVMIGPEGDFTKEEIQLALKHNFVPVSLGNTRLRTETAGIAAAVLMNNRSISP